MDKSPAADSPVWIDSSAALEEAAGRWHEAAAIAVDTEFVRERTFYPALGLVQVGDGVSNVLIDPLALDLAPFLEVLRDESVVKVFHSCSEDMEVFWHRFQELPWPVFDTQIGAAFAGLGAAVSYQSLVSELHGVDLPKGQTRTNWLRRPLRPEQLKYAALDVAYLLPCYEILSRTLHASGRESWALQEMERLRDTSRFEVEPEDVYHKVKGARNLAPRQLAILRALASWREREARRRNLPRNFVVHEAALTPIARLAPRDARQLDGIKGLRDDQGRRHGRAIVAAVKEALALPEDELPSALRRPLDLTPHRDRVDRLRQEVASAAEELGLPAELIAARRTVEKILRRALEGSDSPLSPDLDGWRREAVGERLLAILPG